MNTLAHIGAEVALIWMAVFMFSGEVGEPALGYAVLAAFMLFLPQTFIAIGADWEDIQEWRRRR